MEALTNMLPGQTTTAHTSPVPPLQPRRPEVLARVQDLTAALLAVRDKGPERVSERLLGATMETTAALLQAGRYEEALTLSSLVKSLRRPVPGLDLLRASCFLGLGQAVSALEAAKEELRYFPDTPAARQLLEHLAPLCAAPAESLGSDDAEFSGLLATVRPYTMLSTARLRSLYGLAREALRQRIPGNFVECGVAAGGGSCLLGAVLKAHGHGQAQVYSFDTFEGMPTPSAEDTHCGQHAEDTGWGSGTCAAPVESLLQLARILDVTELIVPVKGLFADTLPVRRGEIGSIALLHMDGDWYESTMDILVNLYDQVAPGGLIQVDDFGHWEGCRKAMQEFFGQRGETVQLTRIDQTGVWFRKPGQGPASVAS